jgi:hypothetical protein
MDVHASVPSGDSPEGLAVAKKRYSFDNNTKARREKQGDVAPRFYPRLSSLRRLVLPKSVLGRASVAGAELRIERSA